jgi:hypothetical protein
MASGESRGTPCVFVETPYKPGFRLFPAGS